MRATEPSLHGAVADGSKAAVVATPDHDLDIVLLPLTRPELGEIRIDASVFAVGRTESPFASYGHDILAMLSRRHARIFCEGGAVYLADLESRNGTTVNRDPIGATPHKLRDGDEIGFGGVLAYRVQIAPRAAASRPEGALTLTLTPESADAGLDAIVVTRFPFLVGKSGAAFARCRDQQGLQFSYLSRRQAHLFVKAGQLCIEDLASTNGTFVDGLRLQEHAVPLHDGALVSFGGEHFTYRVGIAKAAPIDAAVSGGRAAAEASSVPAKPRAATQPAAATDKTTFVLAPTSFLDIFCADDASSDDSMPTQPAALAPAAAPRRSRSRVLWSELASLLAGDAAEGARRRGWKAVALLGVAVALAVTLYGRGAPERELKDAIERSDHAQAALLADRLLAQHPDDADLKSQATEAALKAHVPTWLAQLRAGDFEGATRVLGAISRLAVRNPELRALVGELEWLGQLDQLVSARGGPAAPIRIYSDEAGIEAVIARWNDNTSEHQRALARIAAHVPQFAVPYGEALTHLRKLQSDATVHLAAIERLKATIETELNRDNPQALEAVLKDAAQKYPRLGLDGVRQDLARYIEIAREARSGAAGRVFALRLKARFSTPPFQRSFDALAASVKLPPADLMRRYEATTQAWTEGHTSRALAGLQAMVAGPWADAAARELERKRAVVQRFAALQAARATSGHLPQLLAFRDMLDRDEDVHFMRATAADLEPHKDALMAQARDAGQQARALWQAYRNQGAIEASQRIETSISEPFRARARLLAEACRYAQRAALIYTQIHAPADGAGPWLAIRDEIAAEAQVQRRALHELRNVLDARLLDTKLALLGEPNE